VNLIDEYLFFTLEFKEGADKSAVHFDGDINGTIKSSWGRQFPTVTLQSRGNNLTIYEFGISSIPYNAENVNFQYSIKIQKRYKINVLKHVKNAKAVDLQIVLNVRKI